MPYQYADVKNQPIYRELEKNVDYVNNLVGIGTSWDILAKPFKFGGLNMMSYVTNGFFLTMNMVLILEDVERCVVAFVQEHKDDAYTMDELALYLNTQVKFVQVQPVKTMDDVVRFILSGPLVTFIEGFDNALMIDTRIYPMRSISTPMMERVVRGNHDGFTETMLMNTSLVRRRLRDPRLRVELFQIGNRSQTDVSLMYIKDVAEETLVDRIRNELKNVNTEGMMMGEQELTDVIGNVKWNPYPIVRYTQRPDVASAALLEGQIVIVVDTTSDVIIAPSTFFQHMQHPQEYHSYPTVGTYLRWVIMIAVFLSIFVPGIFMTFNAHPQLIPPWMSFFRVEHKSALPLWAQIIVAEVALDILRLAVINTPPVMGSAVGIVAALLFGQFASQINLLQPEVLVYMGLVMIAQYATSSYELGSANQISRFWIVLWTAILGGWGFLIASILLIIRLATTKSFGIPYLWPLLPFRWKNGIRDIVLRWPTPQLDGVPDILRKRRRVR